jgi:hypothetical protein
MSAFPDLDDDVGDKILEYLPQRYSRVSKEWYEQLTKNRELFPKSGIPGDVDDLLTEYLSDTPEAYFVSRAWRRKYVERIRRRCRKIARHLLLDYLGTEHRAELANLEPLIEKITSDLVAIVLDNFVENNRYDHLVAIVLDNFVENNRYDHYINVDDFTDALYDEAQVIYEYFQEYGLITLLGPRWDPFCAGGRLSPVSAERRGCSTWPQDIYRDLEVLMQEFINDVDEEYHGHNDDDPLDV